jgi:acyl-CoA synthetase (AMP-forming)/AMP-acid ligase II
MLNCSVILEESARGYADKTAVVCTSTQTRVTHKQLIGKVNQLVNALKKLEAKLSSGR